MAALLLPSGEGSPFLLTDSRIRDLDVTPVLGRGYSLMTNNFLATCLMAAQTTAPSYNYDLSFYDFTRSSDYEAILAGPLSKTFAYANIKEEINNLQTSNAANAASSNNSVPRTYFFVTTLRVDRFYSSVKEELSPLSEAATKLLDSQDYIGFFQSCGSNFVRSIRRAQEVTIVFKFNSYKTATAQEFASLLRVIGNGSEASSTNTSQQKFQPILSSMEMKVLGYGLALNQEGTGSLVSNKVEKYAEIMAYSYQAMTQTSGEEKNSDDVGMVYGIEVVPWVDNVAFQVAARIQSEDVNIFLPRSLMVKARHSDPSMIWNNTNSTAERNEWSCTVEDFVKDKYSYCCQQSDLYDPTSRVYGGIPVGSTDFSEHAKRVCRPTRVLDKSIVKSNMSNNGEFVSRLDAALRHKLNQISDLNQCTNLIKSLPASLDNNILKPKDTAAFNAQFQLNFTLKHLKVALDPLGDFGLVNHMSQELDEYTEMFYRICINSLFSSGADQDEATNFMAAPWQSHDRCMQLSCLQEDMRWNRMLDGTCVPSMIQGTRAAPFPDGRQFGCKLDSTLSGDTELCQYSSALMSSYYSKAVTCWLSALPQALEKISYFIGMFCSPEVTTEVANEEDIAELDFQIADKCQP